MLRKAIMAILAAGAIAAVAAAEEGGTRLAQAGSGQPAGAPADPTKAVVPQDALLLVLDSFSIVRMLDEDAYVARREEVARNLLTNLIPFLVDASAAGAAPKPAGWQPNPEVGPIPAGPTPPAPPAPTPPKPAQVTPPQPAKPVVGGPSAAVPAGHENDPAYSRVPQKARIRAKFQAAQAPFRALRAEDPVKADMVEELLSAARAALAKEEFDTAESYVDHALHLLGVQLK